MSAVINNEVPEAQDMAASMASAGLVTKTGEAVASDGSTYATYSLPNDVSEVGKFVMRYDPQYNPFINTLLNRVFSTTVETLNFANPWAELKAGYVEYGDTMEESFIDIPGVHRYSPMVAESEVFKRERPVVHAAFHSLNCQIFHKTTVEKPTLKQAFLSWNGWGDFITNQLNSMVRAGEWDEFQLMRYLVGNAVLQGWVKPVACSEVTDKESAQAFLELLQAENMNFKYPSRSRNLAGVLNATPLDEQTFIQTNTEYAKVNVQALAALFNVQFADYRSTRMAVPSFSDLDWDRLTVMFTNPDTGETDPGFSKWTPEQVGYLDGLAGILLARKWFKMWDNLQDSGTIYNPDGLYWNYTHHMWRTISFSPFEQAVAFSSATTSVTGVTVTPDTATASKGARLVFDAAVAGTGVYSSAVDWSVEGATDPQTNIVDGILTLGPTESGSLTVKATSRQDTAQVGKATVTMA